MFINVTNHTSAKWEAHQIEAAKEYGDIIDIPFPNVSPYLTEEEVYNIALEYREKIKEFENPTVLVAGEYTFFYFLVKLLKEDNIPCVITCSERSTIEYYDEYTHHNQRRSEFVFIKFRRL